MGRVAIRGVVDASCKVREQLKNLNAINFQLFLHSWWIIFYCVIVISDIRKIKVLIEDYNTETQQYQIRHVQDQDSKYLSCSTLKLLVSTRQRSNETDRRRRNGTKILFAFIKS